MDWEYTLNGQQTANAPTGEQMLATLKSEHPRLIINDQTADRVRAILKTDPHAPKWYEQLKTATDAILEVPPSHYEIPDGRRLLSVSRHFENKWEM